MARTPSKLKPPTEEDAAIFAGVAEDPIEDKPTCDAKVREDWGPAQAKGGRSTTTCRDPFPYVMSNEPRGHVWAKYIENLGGAYVGIGSDQNYSYIAQARASWAWVVDYDPRVYRNHLRLRAFILASETPKEFVDLFRPENERQALALLKKTYDSDATVDGGRLRYGFRQTRDQLLPYFEAKMKRLRDHNDFGWLRNKEHYQYIRELLQQGRMRPIRGDLLADGGAMIAMGRGGTSAEGPRPHLLHVQRSLVMGRRGHRLVPRQRVGPSIRRVVARAANQLPRRVRTARKMAPQRVLGSVPSRPTSHARVRHHPQAS